MELALINTLTFFVNVLIEIIPLFLAVTFLAGLALEYIKPSLIREKLGGKKGVTGILAATALGFVTPFCSCSTIPLLAGMLAAGIPISVLTAFLFASPYPVEVGMIVLGPMFGWAFAVAFVATGAILAILSGLLLQRLNWQDQIKDDFIKGLKPEAKSDNAEEESKPACDCGANKADEQKVIGCGCGAEKPEPEKSQAPCGCNAEQPAPETPGCGCGAEPKPASSQSVPPDAFPQKAKRAALYSLTFFKRMIPFILLGCSIGAVIYGFVPQDILAAYMGGSSILAVPIAALIGVPLYVSIIPVIPIVLSLSAKGVSNGAVIAFMITATSISPPELIMLSGMFKRRYLILFVAMMIIGAIATGYVFNAITF
jgi:uncharacterized membrane protein YraQ (UPF0718 family)